MKKILKYTMLSAVLLMLAGVFTSCEKKRDDLCSYMNVKDINKTIPFINDYLSGLPNNLSIEDKIKKIGTWLMESCPLNFYTVPLKDHLNIYFGIDEGLQEFKLVFSETEPLRAIEWLGLYLVPGKIWVRTRCDSTINSVFDFINLLNLDIEIIEAKSYFLDLSADSLQCALDYLNTKPYVKDGNNSEQVMSYVIGGKVYIHVSLFGMKNKNYQADWLETKNKFKLTSPDLGLYGYTIIFQVPDGTEQEWQRKLKEYEIVEDAYFPFLEYRRP